MIELGPKTVTLARAEVVRDFARSELFERTFQEGMELVEDTAAYLDGAGPSRNPSSCPATPPWPTPAKACA